jgi:hypothetical protein
VGAAVALGLAAPSLSPPVPVPLDPMLPADLAIVLQDGASQPLLSGVRASLVFLGLLGLGAALALRPGRDLLFAAAGGCALAYFGLPGCWDSARLLVGVLGVLAAIGGAIWSASVGVRYAFLSGCMLLHFGGILVAVTHPLSPPWLTTQTWTFFYRPYLQFMYLNNAYHFYSPDPGPANLLWFCITYSSGEPKWIVMPRRPADVKDPLALTYYRRLSLTEQTNSFGNAAMATDDVTQRRMALANHIPLHPDRLPAMQYRLPGDGVRKQLLPSYVRYMARANAESNRTIVGIKVYRVEHWIITPGMFQKGQSPFDPALLLPYYQGDYTADGALKDARDPLLYWLIPIVRIPNSPEDADKMRTKGFHKGKSHIVNYVATHAGSSPPFEGSDEKEVQP